MGVEFLQATSRQHDKVHELIETLRANGEKSPELLVEPDGLEASAPVDAPTDSPLAPEDALLDLFRHKSQIPVDAFLAQMREQRHALESR
jgi:hypothetical protein